MVDHSEIVLGFMQLNQLNLLGLEVLSELVGLSLAVLQFLSQLPERLEDHLVILDVQLCRCHTS
jgi:hypothetical protein